MKTPAGAVGRQVGEFVLRNKEIMGLFDSFCMGMINGVFPQKALVDIGMPMESLSQSALARRNGQGAAVAARRMPGLVRRARHEVPVRQRSGQGTDP
jgi:hypothetical protein